MRRLGRFSLIVELGLGSVAFAALFASPLGTTERVFLGASLLLIVFLIDLTLIAAHEFHEAQIKLLATVFAALEKTPHGENFSLTETLNQHMQRERLHNILRGEGIAYVLSVLATYLIWLIAGWALAWLITHGF
jgi:hypothetical protein